MRISDSIDVAANSSERDVLNDTRIKTIPSSVTLAAVTLLLTASQTGAFAEFFIGNDAVVERSGISSQNRVPLIPDDLVTVEEATGGEDLQLNFENTAGTGTTVFYTVDVEVQA
jgi:hypothetical protein